MESLLPTSISGTVALRDGRTLAYEIYGDNSAKAPTIFFFHGICSCRYEAALFDAAARRHGVRIVAPDRPGTGGSTLQPDRTIAQWADDVIQLADAPEINAFSFGILCRRGGASYAIACCAALPSTRLLAVGIHDDLFQERLPRWLAANAPWLMAKILGKTAAMAQDTAHPERLEKEVRGRFKEPFLSQLENDGCNVHALATVCLRQALGLEYGARNVAHEWKIALRDWELDLKGMQLEEGNLVLWHDREESKTPIFVAEKVQTWLVGSELRLVDWPEQPGLLAGYHDEMIATVVDKMN
ncbi:alpha/beta-hydrolase [Thozetella sp. PMI_491]|nr:alpha/beta-hydrolase [Thozetella sp. PMI_491]